MLSHIHPSDHPSILLFRGVGLAWGPIIISREKIISVGVSDYLIFGFYERYRGTGEMGIAASTGKRRVRGGTTLETRLDQAKHHDSMKINPYLASYTVNTHPIPVRTSAKPAKHPTTSQQTQQLP